MKKMVLALVVAAAVCFTAFNAIAAEEAKRRTVEIQTSDGVADIIAKYRDKYVTVRLFSGTEVTGKVALVTTKVVYLTEIRGKEYYDAVLRSDQIASVEIRMRDN